MSSGGERSARWSDAGAWQGDGLRREVFFFESGGCELYGSLYAAAEPSRPIGLLACNSWGVEADRSEPLLRAAALAMARHGGASLVFHYPGYGDSFGDLADLDMSDHSRAASDALEHASRRHPGLEWILAGFMLGASVAALPACRTGVERLLLVQPELRPGAYFRRLATTVTPLAPGPSPREMMEAGTASGMAYGYPVPRRILDRGDEADATVAAALAEFKGEGTAIRRSEPAGLEQVPTRFRRIDVPGVWRFGTQNHPELADATVEWLDRYARQAGR